MRCAAVLALALAGTLPVPLTAQAPSAPTTATASQPWTVFGMELGKPVALPTCKNKVLPGGLVLRSNYEDNPAVTCHEPDIQLSDAPWRRGSVDFPLAKIPLIVRGNTGNTLIVDGNLEGLQFDTLGHANTNAIITELTQKFGRPTSVSRDVASPVGIPVPAVHAEWKLRGLYVSYRNIDDHIDYGELLIETPAMQALRKARDDERDKNRTQL